MEHTFFLVQPANIDDREYGDQLPCLGFVDDPAFVPTREFAQSAARIRFSRGDYDVVLIFGCGWDGHVNLLDWFDRGRGGSVAEPAGYARSLLNAVYDAQCVVGDLLDQHVSIRS
jgi:hypothetical protein